MCALSDKRLLDHSSLSVSNQIFCNIRSQVIWQIEISVVWLQASKRVHLIKQSEWFINHIYNRYLKLRSTNSITLSNEIHDLDLNYSSLECICKCHLKIILKFRTNSSNWQSVSLSYLKSKYFFSYDNKQINSNTWSFRPKISKGLYYDDQRTDRTHSIGPWW